MSEIGTLKVSDDATLEGLSNLVGYLEDEFIIETHLDKGEVVVIERDDHDLAKFEEDNE